IGAAEPRSARFGDGSGARATVQRPQDHGWGAASSQYAKTMIVKIQEIGVPRDRADSDSDGKAQDDSVKERGRVRYFNTRRTTGTAQDWADLLTLSSLSVFESQEAFLREAFEEDGARAKKEQEDAEKKEKARLRKENDRLKEENARLKEDSARLQEENARLRKESTAAGKGKRKASDTGLGGVPSTSAGVEASTTPMRIGVPAEVTETEALATLSTPAFPSGVSLQIIQYVLCTFRLDELNQTEVDSIKKTHRGLTEQDYRCQDERQGPRDYCGDQPLRQGKGSATTRRTEVSRGREDKTCKRSESAHLFTGRGGFTLTSGFFSIVPHRDLTRQGGALKQARQEYSEGYGLSHYAKSRQPYCSERCFKTQDTADEREGRYRQRRPGQQERSVTTGSSRLTPLGRSGKTTVCGASETAEPLPHGQKEICSGGAMRSGR
ncbi:hypothetical protein CF326_g6965, partial [Tilletia indica]